MTDPHVAFSLSNPATWVPSIVAGGLGLYTLVRVFKKDNRNDKQEKQVDEAVQQIINGLRDEVRRLTERVAAMESEIVRLHQERADYLKERADLMARLPSPAPATAH